VLSFPLKIKERKEKTKNNKLIIGSFIKKILKFPVVFFYFCNPFADDAAIRFRYCTSDGTLDKEVVDFSEEGKYVLDWLLTSMSVVILGAELITSTEGFVEVAEKGKKSACSP